MLLLYRETKYFNEIIDAFAIGLLENKINVKIVTSIDYGNDKDVYVLFTTHLFASYNKRLPVRYICYNWEQLTTEKSWSNRLFEIFNNAIYTFDYSLENMKIMVKRGVNKDKIIHVPYGYSYTLQKYLYKKDKDIDVFFFGTMNEKRINILNNIKNNIDCSYFFTNKSFGDSLIDNINRSRIALNIHYYQKNTILEVTRIIPLIANGVVVISEKSCDPWYDKLYEGKVIFIDSSDDIVKKIDGLLKNRDIIDNIARNNLEWIKKEMNYKNIIEKSIKKKIMNI